MAKKITYTRGDGKGGTVTKTGIASNKTAASLSSRSKSSGGSSSKSSSTGLSQAQVDMLRNMPGIDQKALGAYVSSGSVRADSIGKTAPVVIPDKPVQNVGDMLGMNNASVLTPGLTLQNGQFVPDPNASDITNATKEANMNLGNVASSILGYLKPEENQMANAFQDTYGISERQAQKDLARAEAAKSKYTAQLNNITASRDAEMLKLEGQGRGQTQGFIGGEQARINREAAIQALPVQAQLAAAQGDYETAKAHVDQLFQMKIADIQTEMQYKTTVANTLMSVASTQQQNMLQAAIADANARAAEKSQNLQLANQWAQTAIQTGQSTLASKMMALDTKSPTFMQELASLQGQIAIPQSVSSPRAPTTQVIDGKLYQYDYETGQWVLAVDATGDAPMPGGMEAPGGEMDKINLLRDTIARIKGRDADDEKGLEAYDPLYKKASQTPVSEFFGRTFTGSSGLDNLKVYSDTLKSNMLTLAADPTIKDFFGPQMSNADVQQMMAVATRLQPDNMTPEQLLSEVNRLEQFVGKYEAAVKAKYSGQTTNFGIPGAFPAVGGDGIEYIVVPDDYVTSTPNGL